MALSRIRKVYAEHPGTMPYHPYIQWQKAYNIINSVDIPPQVQEALSRDTLGPALA